MGQLIFLVFQRCVPSVGPAQTPDRMQIGLGLNLITYLHLMPGLRMCGAVPPFHKPSLRESEQLYFYFNAVRILVL